MLRNPEAAVARNQQRAQRLERQLVNTAILGQFRNPPPLMVFVALALSSFAVLISDDISTGQIVPSVLLFGLVAVFITLVPQGVTFAVTSISAIAVLKGAQPGNVAIHLVPMFVIFAAAALQLNAEERKFPRPSMILAGIVSFFLSVLFTNLTLTPNSGGGGSTSGNSDDSGSYSEPGWLERFVRWVSRLFGIDGTGGVEPTETVAPGQPPQPPEPIDWRTTVTLLGIVLILAVLSYLIWRILNRGLGSGSGVGGSSADLVRRFERVGSEAGIPRSPSEGLMAYGRQLSTTGDERPLNTGGLVSAAIYDSSEFASDMASKSVADLETSPLPPVAAPPRSRLAWPWNRPGNR